MPSNPSTDARNIVRVLAAVEDLVRAWTELSDVGKAIAHELAHDLGNQGYLCTCGHKRSDHSLAAYSCDFSTCTCTDYKEEKS